MANLDSNIMDQEDLLDDKNFRYTIKPINPKFMPLWKMYKRQQENYWTAEEIDFSNDRYDYEKLSEDEKHYVKMLLAFFASFDSIINLNLRERFLQELKPIEAQYAYGFQQMMENIHAEVYIDMLLNIISDQEERDRLANAFKTVESIKMMADWALRWIESTSSIGHRLIAFAIVEGVFFSGMFASIYWFKQKKGEKFMHGLTSSNHFIARDEGLHCTFACILYSYIRNRVSAAEVIEMMREGVNIAVNFVADTIRCKMIGMNTEMMKQYIEYVADRLLVELDYSKIYGSTNPFDFMESIGFLQKDSFFEVRSASYQRSVNENNTVSWKFKLLEEF